MTRVLVVALSPLFALWLAMQIGRICRCSNIFKRWSSAPVLVVIALSTILYGGRKGTLSFPRTDPSLSYISDAGSYITNDTVHVAYLKLPIVPSSANLIVERRQVDHTNDTDWVQHLSTTFGDSPSPFDIFYGNATNYDWIVYTDWTPGPTVVTNGVWHTWWGEDRQGRKTIIPVRAAVREGANTIATPKSRRH